MLNNTHELIQEISPYWNEQSDLDHFYRNTLRILNSHSERIDTALALLERTIANTICPVCNGDGYTVEADHGCGGDESRCYAICPVQVQAQCDCETHKLNFIKQQNATALAIIQSFRESIIDECKEVIQKAGGLYFIQDKLDKLKQGAKQ